MKVYIISRDISSFDGNLVESIWSDRVLAEKAMEGKDETYQLDEVEIDCEVKKSFLI